MKSLQLLPLLLIALLACNEENISGSKVQQLTLSGARSPLQVGEQMQLTAVAFGSTQQPLSGEQFFWNTSDPAIATVSSSGLVNAIAPGGPVTITVHDGDYTTSLSLVVQQSPSIGMAIDSLVFRAPTGTSSPGPASVPIVNAGTGTLDHLVLGAVQYQGVGGWLTQVTLQSTTAPTQIQLKVSSAGIAPGIYSATVPVTSTAEGFDNYPRSLRILFSVGGGYVQVVAGLKHSCARTFDFRVACWGASDWGQMGTGSIIATNAAPASIFGDLHLIAITAGANHTCGITPTFRAYCWGANASGQLGDGTHINRTKPTLVLGNYEFVDISARADQTCARTAFNLMYCWGNNADGELGDSTTTNRSQPTLVGGGLTFVQIAPGGYHTCGRTATNAWFCWGLGWDGQRGDGFENSTLVPSIGSTGFPFVDIIAGNYFSCGRAASLLLYCWGTLGNGFNIHDGPALLAGYSFSLIRAGAQNICGIAGNSVRYCWGAASDGQVGDGGNTNTDTPHLITGAVGQGMLDFGLGYYHTCGRSSSNDIYCWGRNTDGQLGDGTTISRNIPVAVKSLQ